jgi:hypothetical protein
MPNDRNSIYAPQRLRVTVEAAACGKGSAGAFRASYEEAVHGTRGGRCLLGEPASATTFPSTMQVPRRSGMSLTSGALAVATRQFSKRTAYEK